MNQKEKLRKKWEATGILDGLHSSENNFNVLGNTSSNVLRISNGTNVAGISNNTITMSPNTWIVSVGENLISSYNTYPYTYLETPNENEFTIDVSKGLVKVYDFSKKVSFYILKKFKSILIKEEEHQCVVIERELEPGEIIKVKEYLDGELILEFTEDIDDRYGDEYAFDKIIYSYNIGAAGIVNFPTIVNITPNTIAEDLVTVQPLSAPTGQLFYTDYVYSTNIETVLK